ncbi:MAG TPA: cell division protein ZapA [Bacteroidetes bacterium]|nr:cell division protein ZapA [Bacteroidota bacterium]
MAKNKIRINIAGNYYPVIVENEEEEKTIRKVEKELNRKINEYIRTYKTQNIVDVMALILVQKAVDLENAQFKDDKKKILNKLSEIDKLFDGHPS